MVTGGAGRLNWGIIMTIQDAFEIANGGRHLALPDLDSIVDGLPDDRDYDLPDDEDLGEEPTAPADFINDKPYWDYQ